MQCLQAIAGKEPIFLRKMIEFGRIGYVTKREKMIGKIGSKRNQDDNGWICRRAFCGSVPYV